MLALHKKKQTRVLLLRVESGKWRSRKTTGKVTEWRNTQGRSLKRNDGVYTK